MFVKKQDVEEIAISSGVIRRSHKSSHQPFIMNRLLEMA